MVDSAQEMHQEGSVFIDVCEVIDLKYKVKALGKGRIGNGQWAHGTHSRARQIQGNSASVGWLSSLTLATSVTLLT